MSDVITTLKAARKLITLRKNWTQGWFAHSKTGKEVDPRSRYATCWCASGAIRKFNPNWYADAERALEDAMHGEISTFNDDSSHRLVLRAFDAAIKLAEKGA